MPLSWFRSLGAGAALAALCAAAPAQTPGARVAYRVRVMSRGYGAEPRELARGTIRGPGETDLRLTILTDTADLITLIDLFPGPDTVMVTGAFHARHRAGRSQRGLTLWEVDDYTRTARVAWGGTVRLYPFGSRVSGGTRDAPFWLEMTISRDLVAGDTRAEETVAVADSSVHVKMEAIVRPRRAAVRLTFFRVDSSSAPKLLDMVVDAAARPVTFVLGRHSSATFNVALTAPDPPLAAADSAFGVTADVLCLRVVDPAVEHPAYVLCGRLNNVARKLPLAWGDTLRATFSWPAPR